MKRKITLIIAVVVLCTSCSHVAPPSKDSFLKNKTFVYLFFQTEKECLDNQYDPNFFENCHQQVDFLKDNKVDLMLTDITWRGTYRMEGNVVVLEFEPNFEIPDGEIIFEVLNPAKLIMTDNNTTWKKVSGNSIWK